MKNSIGHSLAHTFVCIFLGAFSSSSLGSSNRSGEATQPERVSITDVFQVKAISPANRTMSFAEAQFMKSIRFDGKTITFSSTHGSILAKTTSSYMNMCALPKVQNPRRQARAEPECAREITLSSGVEKFFTPNLRWQTANWVLDKMLLGDYTPVEAAVQLKRDGFEPTVRDLIPLLTINEAQELRELERFSVFFTNEAGQKLGSLDFKTILTRPATFLARQRDAVTADAYSYEQQKAFCNHETPADFESVRLQWCSSLAKTLRLDRDARLNICMKDINNKATCRDNVFKRFSNTNGYLGFYNECRSIPTDSAEQLSSYNSCLSTSLGVANRPDLCKLVKEDPRLPAMTERGNCYRFSAHYKFCNSLNDSNEKNLCFGRIGECDSITSENEKSSCVRLSFATSDQCRFSIPYLAERCNRIKDSTKRPDCFLQISQLNTCSGKSVGTKEMIEAVNVARSAEIPRVAKETMYDLISQFGLRHPDDTAQSRLVCEMITDPLSAKLKKACLDRITSFAPPVIVKEKSSSIVLGMLFKAEAPPEVEFLSASFMDSGHLTPPDSGSECVIHLLDQSGKSLGKLEIPTSASAILDGPKGGRIVEMSWVPTVVQMNYDNKMRYIEVDYKGKRVKRTVLAGLLLKGLFDQFDSRNFKSYIDPALGADQKEQQQNSQQSNADQLALTTMSEEIEKKLNSAQPKGSSASIDALEAKVAVLIRKDTKTPIGEANFYGDLIEQLHAIKKMIVEMGY